MSDKTTWRFRSRSVPPLPGSAPVSPRTFAAMPLSAWRWAEREEAFKRAILKCTHAKIK